MNKKDLMQDFLNLQLKGVNVSNYDELVDTVSKMFEKEYKKTYDDELAYIKLNDKLNGLLEKYDASFTLGVGEWHIIHDENISDDCLSLVLNKWNNYYNFEIMDINELCDSVQDIVMERMYDAGCDEYVALDMIMDEVFVNEHPFYVALSYMGPRVTFFDELKDLFD